VLQSTSRSRCSWRHTQVGEKWWRQSYWSRGRLLTTCEGNQCPACWLLTVTRPRLLRTGRPPLTPLTSSWRHTEWAGRDTWFIPVRRDSSRRGWSVRHWALAVTGLACRRRCHHTPVASSCSRGPSTATYRHHQALFRRPSKHYIHSQVGKLFTIVFFWIQKCILFGLQSTTIR